MYRLERLILGEPGSDDEDRGDMMENDRITISDEESGAKRKKPKKQKTTSEKEEMPKDEPEDEWIESIVERR